MDKCIEGMLFSALMELFQMVYPRLPRTISKWVSIEHDEYLNDKYVYHTISFKYLVFWNHS